MSPTGIHINKPLIVVICGLVVAVIVFYRMSWKGKTSEVGSLVAADAPHDNQDSTKTSSWTLNPLKEIPSDIKENAKKAEVKDETVSVTVEGKNVEIFTRQASPTDPSQLDVLFLHGQAFTSQNWLDLDTLKLVSAFGYRAVAVDLPGFGQSKEATGISDNVAFMEGLVAALKLKAPVIVSPSMSGGFSLPYLCKDPATVLTRARGFVPVAPTHTKEYAEKFKDMKIPTVIVYGENDKRIGAEALENLSKLPISEPFKLEKAGHAAYMEKTDDFHKILYNFLFRVEKGVEKS